MNYKNTGNNDNQYTPEYPVKKLIPYLHKKTIYDPACGQCHILKVLGQHSFETIGSDIETGTNFLTDDITEYVDSNTCIVTNPPFSLKTQFIERCIQLWSSYQIPFALLLPSTSIETEKRIRLITAYQLEILCWGKRTAFEKDGVVRGQPAFEVFWFTKGLNIELTKKANLFYI